MRQRLSGLSCTQHTPAGLPYGIPGIGDEIDNAMQQAPQPILQSTLFLLLLNKKQEAHMMGQAKQTQHHLFFWYALWWKTPIFPIYHLFQQHPVSISPDFCNICRLTGFPVLFCRDYLPGVLKGYPFHVFFLLLFLWHTSSHG